MSCENKIVQRENNPIQPGQAADKPDGKRYSIHYFVVDSLL